MASPNEAQARVKINKLLEAAGWRFFDDANGKANIVLEPNVKLSRQKIDELGENFESAKNGFVDFLLLDARGVPLLVLEAKSEEKDPLIGKEQARRYAKSLNCRFVILSNGNLHYFWDLKYGNPHVIEAFPTQEKLRVQKQFEPDSKRLSTEVIRDDYIALTQKHDYAKDAGWLNLSERPAFIEKHKLRFLRDYQLKALQAIQKAVSKGADRFLFEMATGTGKTLTSAAVIKLFLSTGNARRVLFLVDRLELEDQAEKDFIDYLKSDFKTAIYKNHPDDWRKAEIVVTTVQSLLSNDKYKKLFYPDDFDLVISDEAHRSIGGAARTVFEYFNGYKLGLTATPRDYLKNTEGRQNDPRDQERRLLLDTYKTFGCESGQPTFRYSLPDGVKDGFLINPLVADARTEITVRLLSEEGYEAPAPEDEEGGEEKRYVSKDFERKFFSRATNEQFCKTFLTHGLTDPISREFGKGLVFAVSQDHAGKITQILNVMADKRWPGRYQSDFAVQVTSNVTDAKRFTVNFGNNKLLGSSTFDENYRTSKARVCVTVGMMTTGYDCPDLLNIALMRPIYSPSEFVQIKGRGTRKHDFTKDLRDERQRQRFGKAEKTQFKLFDFFANCEYFEEKFNYDEVLTLPARSERESTETRDTAFSSVAGVYEHTGADLLHSLAEQAIGPEGMKIDRMFFQKFEEQAKADPALHQQITSGHWEEAEAYVERQLFNKPAEFFTLEKLREAAGSDRRLSLKEILQKIFGLIPQFKSKDELLEEHFQAFVTRQGGMADVTEAERSAVKYYFKTYVTDATLRAFIDSGEYTALNTYPPFGMKDFRAVPEKWRKTLPEYVKDHVPLNPFM